MSTPFAGKVAVVTGGNSGIGRATTLAMAARGASVVVAARREQEGNAVVAEIVERGGKAVFVGTDVTSTHDITRMIDSALNTFGGLDYAFNNAGSGLQAPEGRLHERDEAFWDHYHQTFLKSVFVSMKAEISVMLNGAGGVIVNNASVAGLQAHPGNPTYAAMKFGVVGLTRSAAMQYGEDNIRINAVCPGWIETPMTAGWVDRPEWTQQLLEQQATKRPGQPGEVAELVAWLCEDGASFMNGAAIPVDGGLIA
ncbi:MAG: SDR family oxidoreductase [Alphaproteobacteria bacterium]|jgi:NAD(P)-dependent dehydrogenase (short-subunit alcohol dehydrogenase family)|nr:SDR family oxidoreductase [Alphaproteobacteria bacterium]